MKVFDFNRHLISKDELTKDVQKTIDLDKSMDAEEMVRRINGIDDGIDGGNMMLFNEAAFESAGDFENFFSSLQPNGLASYTLLFDFRRKDVVSFVEMINATLLHAVKLHPYQQQIREDEYAGILKTLQKVDIQKLILIDTSYGSLDLFTFHPLKLAAYLAKHLPHKIVLLHSGGAKIIDAMLIAEANANIYLDTSLSLEYYIGSSVGEDMMFAYKKVGAERVLYGTDRPFFGFAPQQCAELFEGYGFGSNAIERIMYDNAIELLGL